MQSKTNMPQEEDVLAPTPIKESAVKTQASKESPGPQADEGDKSESTTSTTSTTESENGKRYIPEHKKPDAALTFPEKLMQMMKEADKQDHETHCVAWLPDGKSFVIRDADDFTRNVVPKYFKATKFSSFTRKLYRWGFRQVNRGIGPDDPIIFGNDFFQRDELDLMTKMRSTTAASTRKEEESSMNLVHHKRALEMMESEQTAKRILLMNQMMKRNNVLNAPMFPNTNGLNLNQAMMSNSGRGFFNHFNNQNTLMNSFPSSGMNGLAGFNGLNVNANPFAMNNANPSSTSDIVNAAMNALRYAP